MSEPQSPFPTLPVVYDEVATAQTVRAATLTRMAQACDALASGRPARRAHIDQAYPDGTTARTYVVSYKRTSDAIAFLYLAAHSRLGYRGDQLTIDLTIRDGAGHSVASSSDLIPVGFKVGTIYTVPASVAGTDGAGLATLAYVATIADGYLDLAALAATLTDPDWSLEFSVAAPTGTSSLVDLVEAWEMPRGVVDSGDTYGSLVGALMPGRPLTSGPISGADDDGMARLRQTLTGARLSQRTYAQECFGPDDVTAALLPRTTSLAYAALDGLDDGTGTATAYTFRVRTITGASAGEVARARFRYLVSGGGSADLKVTTGISSYALSGLTSATWAWSPWLAVHLKANATGHLETVQFEGKTSAGTLYVSSWILEEDVS